MAAAPGAWAADEISAASARVEDISDELWASMQDKSWHDDVPGCATRKELALVTLPYWNFEGEAKLGRMIVARRVADDVAAVFSDVFSNKSFAFARIELVDKYGGDDHASMAANNTSAYNCRLVNGTTRLSAHAKGLAMDINPIQNPFVTSKVTSPIAGVPYNTIVKRKAAVAGGTPGVVLKGDALYRAFIKRGWFWGGEWKSSKDYQHFSEDGH